MITKRTKKWVSILLAVVMLLTCFGSNVFAAEPESPIPAITTLSPENGATEVDPGFSTSGQREELAANDDQEYAGILS